MGGVGRETIGIELEGDLHCLFYLLLYYLPLGLQGNCVDFVIFFF